MNHEFPKPGVACSSLAGDTDEKQAKEGDYGPDSLVRIRLLDRADRTGGPDACWPWAAARNRDGYGRMWIGRREVQAHRLSYELFVGPLAADAVVMHSCDHPSCVNPAHLRSGTRADNNRDCKSKDRHTRGNRTHSARLTDEQVQDIRFRHHNGDSRYSLAARYGVSHREICLIVRGQRWRHLLTSDDRPQPADEARRHRGPWTDAIAARIAARRSKH